MSVRRVAVKRATLPHRPRSKYRAIKETVDGITFHSRKEARRYGELKLLEKARKISRLICQPKFPLMAETYGVPRSVIGHYIADFAYEQDGEEIVEDVKGFKTPLYRWKKKHVEAQYGITVREV